MISQKMCPNATTKSGKIAEKLMYINYNLKYFGNKYTYNFNSLSVPSQMLWSVATNILSVSQETVMAFGCKKLFGFTLILYDINTACNFCF